MFTIRCNKSEIRSIGEDTVASGTQKVLSVRFKFSDDWNGIATKIAQFSNDKSDIISIPIDESCEVDVPWEVLTTPKTPVYVGVYGIGEDGVRLPTLWCNLCYVATGVPSEGRENREPTPDFFDRMERIVAESNKRGADGYTPKKGLDYFTESEKQQLVQDVLALIPSGNGVTY